MLLREKKKITANKFIYYDFFLLLSSLLPFLLLLLLLFHWCVGCNFVFIQRIAGTKFPPSTVYYFIWIRLLHTLYNVRISVQQQCKISVRIRTCVHVVIHIAHSICHYRFSLSLAPAKALSVLVVDEPNSCGEFVRGNTYASSHFRTCSNVLCDACQEI